MNLPALLPDADALFRTYFYAWYSDGSAARHPDRVRSDIEEHDLPPGSPDADLHPLAEGERPAVAERIERMIDAATADLGRLTGARPPIDPGWIDAADAFFTRQEVNRLLTGSNARQFSNSYLILTCELGALLAHVLRTRHPVLTWIYDEPYWESGLFDPGTRTFIPIFHWAIRKMSETGIDDSLAEKVTACLQRLQPPG